ncbi:5-hydroxytryptamine receptor 3A-like isoform X2 [Pygocentrus nattereri]|uniref:Neurotransmitter-gated ion-channel ligand-binding domain-containing protein n=1 Tax=Pygocentrus nattereri TaxID=42514 RepID=A0AAR2KJJ1_PYGNA|nr:5-hydroxytryptamine receptor 3A-like isoform X2 [Pygocentrus nattereri]
MAAFQKGVIGLTLLMLESTLLLLMPHLISHGAASDPPHFSLIQWLDGVTGAESARLRPVSDWRSTVGIKIDLSILSVLGVGWEDERLRWDPSEYGGVLRVTIPAHKIWLPDIILHEMANTDEDSHYSRVSVTSAGWVELQQPRLLESSCPLNLYHFPLDQHTCNLTFLSQSHTVKEVEVYWGRREKDSVFSRGEWEILSLSVPANLQPVPHFNTSAVRVQVTVRRSPLLYMVTLLLPSALMLVLDLLAFLIPVCLKQRLSVMAAVYTGHFIFIITVFTLFPPFTLQLPLIEIYLFGSLALLALGAVETAVLFQLANERNSWVAKRIFPALWQLMGRRQWEEPQMSRGSGVCICMKMEECACDLQVELSHVRHFLQSLREERNTLSMCRELSSALDRSYLCLHCLVLAIGGAVLYCQWRRTA